MKKDLPGALSIDPGWRSPATPPRHGWLLPQQFADQVFGLMMSVRLIIDIAGANGTGLVRISA
jgi:hypothetical protein